MEVLITHLCFDDHSGPSCRRHWGLGEMGQRGPWECQQVTGDRGLHGGGSSGDNIVTHMHRMITVCKFLVLYVTYPFVSTYLKDDRTTFRIGFIYTTFNIDLDKGHRAKIGLEQSFESFLV